MVNRKGGNLDGGVPDIKSAVIGVGFQHNVAQPKRSRAIHKGSALVKDESHMHLPRITPNQKISSKTKPLGKLPQVSGMEEPSVEGSALGRPHGPSLPPQTCSTLDSTAFPGLGWQSHLFDFHC